ncbi:unnamed protein product [Ranitomeya imitator]|uniref:Uncharacterized protein n=1 Tax=Ranitomeya imitator TaxID=111125 RepID=A0ABN9L5A7_9NEOB|nr:unnamed protein product [Ranitomeya imitator]
MLADTPWRLPDRSDLLSPEFLVPAFNGMAVEAAVLRESGFSQPVIQTMFRARKPASSRIYHSVSLLAAAAYTHGYLCPPMKAPRKILRKVRQARRSTSDEMNQCFLEICSPQPTSSGAACAPSPLSAASSSSRHLNGQSSGSSPIFTKSQASSRERDSSPSCSRSSGSETDSSSSTSASEHSSNSSSSSSSSDTNAKTDLSSASHRVNGVKSKMNGRQQRATAVKQGNRL